MLWKDILLGVLRAVIASTGGYLIANGKLAADDVNTIVGGISTVVPAIWSAFDKIKKAKGS